jgi:OFA family oxalate/formate antiporter-like MFS transporter
MFKKAAVPRKGMPDVKRIRYFYLVNSFILLLFMGTSFAWSIFASPLETHFGWTRADTSLAFTLNTVFFTIGNIFSGTLSSRISDRNIVRLSACLIASGFLLTTQIHSVWQLYITYSMLCGGGVGVGYVAIVNALPLWFPDKSGFITGILLTGYALSACILGPFSQWMISMYNWQAAFTILAVMVFIVLITGSINLRGPSAEEAARLPSVPGTAVRAAAEKDYSAAEMLKTSAFWLYFLSRVVSTGIGLTIFNHLIPRRTGIFPI